MFSVIIPARYASTRLPGKSLVDIAGKPMLQHVYERALQSGAEKVIIATDDERIMQSAKEFGAQVLMTSTQHQSGTERIAEAVQFLRFPEDSIVVNVQCDEPLIPPRVITQTAENLLLHPAAQMATLCCEIDEVKELLDANVVKVVMDKDGYALYFSRAPIAWDRNSPVTSSAEFSSYAHFYRHIGLYAYRVSAIKRYVAMPSCYLEQMEALEQLRLLWNGERIHVAIAVEAVPPGVDSPADLEFIRKRVENGLVED